MFILIATVWGLVEVFLPVSYFGPKIFPAFSCAVLLALLQLLMEVSDLSGKSMESYRNTGEAINVFRKQLESASRINILAYDSRTCFVEFSKLHFKHADHLQLRVLIRDPESDFLIPREQKWKNRKKDQLNEYIAEWKAMMAKKQIKSWDLYLYPFEPQIKAITIDEEVVLLGHYKVKDKPDPEDLDYQGEELPLVRLNKRCTGQAALIEGFMGWFNDVIAKQLCRHVAGTSATHVPPSTDAPKNRTTSPTQSTTGRP